MPNDVQDWTAATVQPQDLVAGGNPWAIDTSVVGGSASKLFTLPLVAGIHVVGFGISGPGAVNYGNLTVTGHQTGIQYAAITGILNSQLLLFPILSVYDTQIDVTVGYTVGVGILNMWVASIKDTQALQVLAPTPLAVIPFDAVQGRHNVFDETGGASSQGVSLLNSSPPPWLIPNIPAIDVNVTLGGANTSVLKAGVANQKLYLHHVRIGYSGESAAITLEDQHSNVAWRSSFANVYNGASPTVSLYETDSRSQPLATSGDGLVLHNASGVSKLFAGTIYASQL